jgi:uncharacterized radical SAM superfamily protein
MAKRNACATQGSTASWKQTGGRRFHQRLSVFVTTARNVGDTILACAQPYCERRPQLDQFASDNEIQGRLANCQFDALAYANSCCFDNLGSDEVAKIFLVY